MILLDPDLDPPPHGRRPVREGSGPTPQTKPARTSATGGLSARALALFLKKAQDAVRLRGQVSVLLTTDSAIRKLNRQFRGKNTATDVLSFPALEPSQVSNSRPGAHASRLAGDLAISVETARKQAAACGHSLGMELKVLMLHGLLHLAGYDHETDGGEMARNENALRAKLGLPQGLIERNVGESASQRAGKSAAPNLIRKKRGGGGALGEQAHPKVRPTAAARREATKIAQGEAQPNPGKAPASRSRRPVGPARSPKP